MSTDNNKTIDKTISHLKIKNTNKLNVAIHGGDITKELCDAIVCPTNECMVPDDTLDYHIHQSLGQFFTEQVIATNNARKENSCPVGQSRIFIAKFNPDEKIPRHVISTVGPVYSESEKERAAYQLQSCYYTSLTLANIYNLSSIAFPAISCGTNGFPPMEAARIAFESITTFCADVKDIRFVLHDPEICDIYKRVGIEFLKEN